MSTALLEPSRDAAAARGSCSDSDRSQADAAVAIAKDLLAASLADESPRERRRRARLGRLLADEQGRELTIDEIRDAYIEHVADRDKLRKADFLL